MNASGMVLATLAGHFLVLSLLAVGGVNSTLPEMHRIVVDTEHWMSASQFADLFAIAQAAPGPNMMVVTLIGWHVAGFAGATVATLAMCGPTCLLTYGVSSLWSRFEGARWRIAVQAGIAPVTVGLIAASAWILAESANHSAPAWAITAAAAAITYFTRVNPLWVLAGGAVLGVAGLL